jgi:hypothetical protein
MYADKNRCSHLISEDKVINQLTADDILEPKQQLLAAIIKI